MSNYRIVKNTYADSTFKFVIEKESLAYKGKWNYVTERELIADARHAVVMLEGQELVSSEVVE